MSGGRASGGRAAAWGVLSSASGVGLLATSGWLITRASLRPPVLSLCVAIGLVQAFSLGRGAARYLQRLGVHRQALTRLAALRLALFDRAEPLVPGAATEDGVPMTAAVLSGFLSDADAVAEAGARVALASVDVGATVVLGTALTSVLVPAAGLVLAIGGLGTVVAVTAAVWAGRTTAAHQASVRAEVAAQVIETVAAARELAAYGRDDLLDAALARWEVAARRDARRAGAATGLGRAVATWGAGATALGVVAAGLSALRAGHLSGVLLAVATFTALAVAEPLAALPPAVEAALTARAATARLDRLASVPRPAAEPACDADPPAEPFGAALQHARVEGAGGTARLDDATLAVAPGRRVALVGRSGSGKSTALHALLHFVECARGAARLGGVDVRDLRRASIARHAAWLPEETYLFAATLAENLRIGRPAATAAECEAVLRRVGLGRWLATLPDGLGTVLGAGGRAVSAGEQQRLGLARALLADGEVLLLDEPTAHLDPDGGRRLLTGLLASAGDRAVLVVSHEPGLARLVDEVVALPVPGARPRVTASEPPVPVRASGGPYAARFGDRLAAGPGPPAAEWQRSSGQ